jgi:hypothetical protein
MDPGLRRAFAGKTIRAEPGVLPLLEDNDQIPLFDAEKQQKTAVPALCGPNSSFQVVDFI